jgi:Suppressor of fused protein (SUFU)
VSGEGEGEATGARLPSGRIYRHTERMAQLATEGGNLALVESIIAHMTAQVGKPVSVLQELMPTTPSIDIHIVPPSEDDPVITLFTTGMSEHEMHLPPEVRLPRRAELILRLPESWPISEEALTHLRTAWPIHWLRTLARLPQRYGTWLAPLHTIPNGEPPQPLAEGTELCCMMTVPPICVEEDGDVVDSPVGRVMLISVMPIYESEMRFKLARGPEALLELLAAKDIDDVVDLQRPRAC